MIAFVDSGAHLALLYPDDQHHLEAASYFPNLRDFRLITSMAVLAEVGTRGARVAGARATADYLRTVLSNPRYHVFDVHRDLAAQSLDALVKYEDQGLSFTDCTSVLIMRSGRVKTIFTFDRAFRRLGFQVVP